MHHAVIYLCGLWGWGSVLHDVPRSEGRRVLTIIFTATALFGSRQSVVCASANAAINFLNGAPSVGTAYWPAKSEQAPTDACDRISASRPQKHPQPWYWYVGWQWREWGQTATAGFFLLLNSHSYRNLQFNCAVGGCVWGQPVLHWVQRVCAVAMKVIGWVPWRSRLVRDGAGGFRLLCPLWAKVYCALAIALTLVGNTLVAVASFQVSLNRKIVIFVNLSLKFHLKFPNKSMISKSK